MKKFNKDGSDTKQWKEHKKRVLAAGGMIGNSPMAYVLAKREAGLINSKCDELRKRDPRITIPMRNDIADAMLELLEKTKI